MKLSLSSFAITALISTGNVLSTAQNYAFVGAATAKAYQPKKKQAPKPKEEKKEERMLDEIRSILRKKIKTMTELRMKTVGLRGGHLRLTGGKCVKPGDTYLESIRKYATPIYPALKPMRIKSIVSPAG
jgi:hypothetical protein